MLRIIRREEKEGKEGGQKKGEELEQEGPSRDQNWREKGGDEEMKNIDRLTRLFIGKIDIKELNSWVI